MEHVLAKTILTSQTIELIAQNYRIGIEEARERFYNSKLPDLLDDDETGLYGESAWYLFSIYEEQMEKNIDGNWLLIIPPTDHLRLTIAETTI